METLYEKFLKLIDNTKIGSYVEAKRKLIEETDPDRIYVENIRSFFNFPHHVARGLCELAVREGLFIKRIGLLCPNKECGRIIEASDSCISFNKTVKCQVCELREIDKYEFESENLETIVFFKLKKSNGD